MDETTLTRYITDTYGDTEVTTAWGATFFFCGSERKFPFATLTTTDENDSFSDLNRPGIFRLNVGVSKATYQSLFDSTEGHDYTTLDRIMPHPVYGKMYWVCVLNPSAQTFLTVQPLLTEAHALAKDRHDRHAPDREIGSEEP
jgi:hypothetical protein